MLMRKGRIANGMQRVFIFGCVASLMTGFIFTGGNASVADEVWGKTEICTLESVTLTVPTDENATPITIRGGLQPIIVDKNATWNDYFGNRTIGEVSFIEDDACTAKGSDNHSYVAGYVFAPSGNDTSWGNLWTLKQQVTEDGTWYEWMCTTPWERGNWNYISDNDLELDDTVGYYDVKFEPRFGMIDGTSPTGIYVRFAKEYDITYNLDGGSFVDAAPETYVAGTEYQISNPIKDGYLFTGWTSESTKTPTKELVIAKDSTGDITCTANWEKQKEIFNCDISFKDGDTYTYTGAEIKPVVVIMDGETTLVEGIDYTVEYMNNVKVPAKDSSDLPTVTVMGIGKYTGVSVMYFTIESPWAEVGEVQKSKDGKATYEVTESEDGEVEVTFVEPSKKTKTVTVPATVTLADGTKAEVTAIDAKAFKGNTKLETVIIGKNVETIGKEAFKGCKNLKKVKSAKNVEKIGKEAFANCTKLNSVAMSSDITSIGEKAFYNCKALAKITIPKNVKSIGKSAFQNCKNLKTITIKTTLLTKKNVKKNAFKGISSKAKIDVPNSKRKAYTSLLRDRGVSKNATIK